MVRIVTGESKNRINVLKFRIQRKSIGDFFSMAQAAVPGGVFRGKSCAALSGCSARDGAGSRLPTVLRYTHYSG